jgi:uncharacterized protein YbjT (DUF2867 family)
MLLEHGHELSALARSQEARANLVRWRVLATDVSLFDPSALSIAAGHEVVINLATRMPPSSGRMPSPAVHGRRFMAGRDFSRIQ